MATIEENIQQIANDVNSIKTNLGLSSNASLQDVVNKSEGAIKPTGTIDITENGTVDVANYATANVNVSGGGGGLPQSIRKIDAGTFSVVGQNSVTINHNLGEIPDYVMVWNMDGDWKNTNPYALLGFAGGVEIKKGTIAAYGGKGMYRYTMGSGAHSVDQAGGQTTFTSTQIKVGLPSSTYVYFLNNHSYFWVAICV